jgi:RNA polymerase sigma-70 factor (ECF subfamily)
MTQEHDDRFETLYRRYYKRMVGFLMYLNFPLDEARDLAQETFLRVYRHMEGYRGEAEWRFLRIAAQNVVKNWIRDNSTLKRKAARVSIDDIADPVDPKPAADVAFENREETARFRKKYDEAIAALPEGPRQCLLLREQGYSYDEIAAILRIPMNSVKSRLHDAKRRLREHVGLEWRGIDERQD